MSGSRVGVLDYGSGNLHSVCRALDAAGGEVVVGQRPADFATVERLVVPGVGAFAACMRQLRGLGADLLIRDWVASGRQLLGICVGFQVLFERGVEHGVDCAGVAVLPGTVERLTANRLPHMGWNQLSPPSDRAGIFAGLDEHWFYFVHSYGVHAPETTGQSGLPADAAVAWTEHGGDRFIAGVQCGGLTATQFHPEKSGASGAVLLRRWLMS